MDVCIVRVKRDNIICIENKVTDVYHINNR